jgi:hypothetical protein
MRDRILRKRDAEEVRGLPDQKKEIGQETTPREGFDFDGERARLKAMTDEELRTHTDLCRRALTSSHRTEEGVWHDLNRFEMAEGEWRRRHDRYVAGRA